MIEALAAAGLYRDPAGEAAVRRAGDDVQECRIHRHANSAPPWSNAIFCRPGTKLVEIIAEGQFDPWSSHFGAMNRFEHVVLFQHQSLEALLKDPRHDKDSEFAYDVDVPRLVETVETMLRD